MRAHPGAGGGDRSRPAEPAWGSRRRTAASQSWRSDPRARIYADPARACMSSASRAATKSAPILWLRSPRRSMGLTGASPDSRRSPTGATAGRRSRRSRRGQATNPQDHREAGELAQIVRPLAEDHETAALLRALDGRFIRPGRRRRHPPQSRDPADRAQPARLRPLPHSERVRDRRRRAAGRAAARRAYAPTAIRSPNAWRSCSGAPTISRARAARSVRRWR